METISFEKIAERAECLKKVDPNDTYHKAYFHFVNYFTGKSTLSEHDLIIGASFTYAWMPTIMHFKSDTFESAVGILNKAKKSERISSEELLILKSLINNSLVGVSKLLHFINPEIYAIWDSKVCNCLTGKSYKQKVESIDQYWCYLDLCVRVIKNPQFAKIHDDFVKRIGYQISPMRTVEQILFITSKNPIK